MSRISCSTGIVACGLAIGFLIELGHSQNTEAGSIVSQLKVSYVGALLTEREHHIAKTVRESDAKFDYFEQRFGDVIEELKAEYEIPIILHESAREASLDEDTLITLNVSGISLNSGLAIMLHPFKCTYAVKDQVLYIVSEDFSDELMETRIYDCTDLIDKINAPNQQYDTLVKVVTTIVEPTSWTENDGRGRIVELAGRLIVSQTHRLHDEIANLLKSLDEEFSQ